MLFDAVRSASGLTLTGQKKKKLFHFSLKEQDFDEDH